MTTPFKPVQKILHSIQRAPEIFRVLVAAGDSAMSSVMKALDYYIANHPQVLADQLRRNPEYQSDILNHGLLKFGQKESPPNLEKNRDGIPPVPYRRLVTCLQMGLSHFYPSLKINGNYDKFTKDAVWNFQQKAGLELERDGTFVDRSTLGALILYLETSRENLIAEVEEFKKTRTGGQFLDHDPQLARVVVRALQYLYPARMSPYTDLDQTPGLKDSANGILETEFGGTLVGPKILTKIIKKLIATLRPAPAEIPSKWPTPGSLPDPRTVG